MIDKVVRAAGPPSGGEGHRDVPSGRRRRERLDSAAFPRTSSSPRGVRRVGPDVRLEQLRRGRQGTDLLREEEDRSASYVGERGSSASTTAASSSWFCPQGTLAERMRAGGARIAGLRDRRRNDRRRGRNEGLRRQEVRPRARHRRRLRLRGVEGDRPATSCTARRRATSAPWRRPREDHDRRGRARRAGRDRSGRRRHAEIFVQRVVVAPRVKRIERRTVRKG